MFLVEPFFFYLSNVDFLHSNNLITSLLIDILCVSFVMFQMRSEMQRSKFPALISMAVCLKNNDFIPRNFNFKASQRAISSKMSTKYAQVVEILVQQYEVIILNKELQ